MEYLQNALNRYRTELRSSLEDKHNEMPEQMPSQKISKFKMYSDILQYKTEAFDGDRHSHPEGRDAAAYCQYQPPAKFEDEGLSHINCTRGTCEDCPKYSRPLLDVLL